MAIGLAVIVGIAFAMQALDGQWIEQFNQAAARA
jgi:hypothetical protein